MSAKLLSLLGAFTALAACGDPTRPRAEAVTISDTLSVFALTGTPLSVPTALNTLRHAAVRTDPGASYDVVFDITDAGQAMIYPPAAVGAFGRAGIQKSTTPFDELLEAPVSGYNETTPTEINPGDVLLIRAVPPECGNSFSAFIFSKLVIDSVNTDARTIHFRMRVDPNCGFRSLAEGIPER